MAEPLGLRTPASLTFRGAGVTDRFNTTVVLANGDFTMGDGAVIRTDPKGSVQISGNTAAILGSIVAPGGSINVSAAFLATPAQALPNLDLGPKSFLSTAGTVVLLPDRRGYRTGIVLGGGTITITGNIVAEAGSVLDVSGTSGILDISPAYSNVTTPLLGALSGNVS